MPPVKTPPNLSKELRDFVWQTLAPFLKHIYGAPPESIKRLETDDDWTFLIKIHALLEAALSAILMTAIDHRLESFVTRLETGSIENGKLAWIKKLKLLEKPEMDFVRIVSPWRNKAVHNIRHLDFTFSSCFAAMTSTDRTHYISTVRELTGDSVYLNKKLTPIDIAAFQDPRAVIFYCTFTILGAAIRLELESERRSLQSPPKPTE